MCAGLPRLPAKFNLDFGMNPNIFGAILEEPLKLSNRVVLSPDTVKRLCPHLAAYTESYESRYGTIELELGIS